MDTRQDTPAVRLEQGAAALSLPLTPEQRVDLLGYLDRLVKWNEVYNLTGVRDPREMVTRHLLDSLSVLPYIKARRVLDVGTGAGLPGIPLAIALPDLQFVLLDSAAKKTRFIVQVIGELGLHNVVVETRRAEGFRPADLFDTVISRAFASISEFIAVAGALCRPGGALLAMKGRHPVGELSDLPKGFRLREVVRLAVPGLAEERHAVCIDRY